MRRYASMAHDDEELYDMSKGMPNDYEPPEYPGGLCLNVPLEALESVGGDKDAHGGVMRFSAMAEVTSKSVGMDDCRIELEVHQLAGQDGKFVELEQPAHICLTERELDKLGLEPDCELGDWIHLIGTARLDRTMEGQFGNSAGLQIIELTFEDESEESREA